MTTKVTENVNTANALANPLTLQAAVAAVISDLTANPITVGDDGAQNSLLRQPLSSHLIDLDTNSSSYSGHHTITLPNPLLLQALPPRLCANAIGMAAHGVEKVLRLVYKPSPPPTTEERSDKSYTGTQPKALTRSIYQVGSHYNLYPMLYCSCSAFRYHCIMNNGTPIGGHATSIPNHPVPDNGQEGRRTLGSTGLQNGSASTGGSAFSNSMMCKHLATVAILVGEREFEERTKEANSQTDETNAPRNPSDPTSRADKSASSRLPFPKERMINIRGALANTSNTQHISNNHNHANSVSSHSFESYSLGAGASSFLVAQLLGNKAQAAATGSQRSSALGVIEEKEISFEEFIRIMGSELF